MQVEYTETLQVCPADIQTDDQPICAETVEAIASTLRNGGQIINPLTLTRLADGKLKLVAGRHRLAAAIRVNLKAVPARVVAGDDAAIELIEIDENLARRKIAKADEAALICRRDALLVRNGVASKAKRDQMQANGMGISARSVRRSRKRAATLGTDTIQSLQGTSLAFLAELDALCALDETTRKDLIKRALTGEEVRATDAHLQLLLSARNTAPLKVQGFQKAWRALDRNERVEAMQWLRGEVGTEYIEPDQSGSDVEAMQNADDHKFTDAELQLIERETERASRLLAITGDKIPIFRK